MRHLFYCVFVFILVLGLTGTVFGQAAKVQIVGVSDRFSTLGESSAGLSNVGVGALVTMQPIVQWNKNTPALSGKGYGDTLIVVTSAVWTVTGPRGVVATTDSVAIGLVVRFRPDTIGTYNISVTATTSKGDFIGTTTVKAATYQGVGIYNLATTNWDKFNCQPCHVQSGGVGVDQIFSDYRKTNHATAFARKVNQAGGHFGNSCLKCHSIGYNTSAQAVNGGFDDLKTQTGYSTPANGPGKYDSLAAIGVADTNAAWTHLMQETSIQCENCHGPAGEHATTGDPTKMAVSWSSDVCAPCHFSSDRHPKGYSWATTAHAVSTTEGPEFPQYTNRGSCARCHTGQGFVNEYIKKNPPPTVPTGEISYAGDHGITCQACHDPHNKKNPLQLRTLSVADACIGCHTTRFSGQSGLHHAHQGPMLMGIDAPQMAASVPMSGVQDNIAGWEFPGYFYTNSDHSEIVNRCAECHMANSPDYDPTYASPDTLLNKVGGHTFRIVWDAGTPTVETDDVLNDVGCRECHGPVSLEFVKLSQDNIKVLLVELYNLLPKRDTIRTTDWPNGTPSFAQDANTWQRYTTYPGKRPLTVTEKAAAYNYAFVNNDGSFGVHNHKYAEQLLRSSIEQLKLGAGAANVMSIKDIPGDQGRNVQIVWRKFPAEKSALSRVIRYSVFRKDNVLTKEVAQPRKSLTELISSATPGVKYSVNGTVWTQVNTGPIEVQPTTDTVMAYIAPTLADSSAGGTSVTEFMVAGYTADPTVIYASPVATGYSIDNIAPFKVTQFTVTVDPTGAVLNWKPVDQDDVVEFLVYRGTTRDFTPTTPLATVKGMSYTDAGVTTGQAYWYIVQGVDKSGNKGEISSPTGTTGVEMADGIPTEYALGQNYPNPFNPTTVIPFSLPNGGHVVLKVYTISGEEVATLIDREMGPGNYNFTWDGRNKAGMTVATGMYLYRLQSDKFSSVKKMVLVK